MTEEEINRAIESAKDSRKHYIEHEGLDNVIKVLGYAKEQKEKEQQEQDDRDECIGHFDVTNWPCKICPYVAECMQKTDKKQKAREAEKKGR